MAAPRPLEGRRWADHGSTRGAGTEPPTPSPSSIQTRDSTTASTAATCFPKGPCSRNAACTSRPWTRITRDLSNRQPQHRARGVATSAESISFWNRHQVAEISDDITESESLDLIEWRNGLYPGLLELMPVNYPGYDILDFGCGPGHDTIQFLLNGA